MEENQELATVTEPTESETENTTQNGLAQMFEQDLTSTEEPEETSVEEEPEEAEEDVLSQSVEEEPDEGDGDEKVPKSVQKLLRQVNQLTARAKSAEEQLQQLHQQKMASGKSGDMALNEIHNMEDLEKYKQTATKARKFAMANLGKDFVEHNGEEYDADKISNLLQEADEALTSHIPDREKHIKERANVAQTLPNLFPWMGTADNPVTQVYNYGRQLPELSAIHSMSHGDLVFGLMAEGYSAMMAKQNAMQKAKPKATKKPEPPKSVSPSSAPPKQNSKDSNQILGDGNISLSTFSQFLDSKEEK